MTIQQILLKYWGYSTFRPLQEEIIQSVLDGKDTLALLPTGGGKSITYQLPALHQKGICLVVTPLISLMKDQVDSLKKRGIKAGAIHSGMYSSEIEMVLNNSLYGENKLLYVSPERLMTTAFRDALQRMKISLIAVDEAHCISQWGYDFRPPYLRISEIRELCGKVPILALTATATPKVITNIQEKLEFRGSHLFRASFGRKNLIYFVFREEDKRGRMLKIISKVKGSGIIYVRNRRHTREIADFLTKEGIPATFYHAGLESRVREQRQNAWMKDELQVIVATNAFGMGIDKPNVRFVIHADLPDSIEAYFQESGRAGRDGMPSVAVLLFEKADLTDSNHNFELSFPDIRMIRKTYEALGNYFRIPVGSGMDATGEFDIGDFSKQYNLNPVVVFNVLKLLEKEGYLVLGEALKSPARIFLRGTKESLYQFQVENEKLDHFIKTLLRSYSGVFTEFVSISENDISARMNISVEQVTKFLSFLHKSGVLEYLPRTDKPRLTFTQDRVESDNLTLSATNYQQLMKNARQRLDAIVAYAESADRCRSSALLEYFGEKPVQRCGKCDVCIERNRLSLTDLEYDSIEKELKEILRVCPKTLVEIIALVKSTSREENIIRAVQWLADNGKIAPDTNDKYSWNEN